jgi:hypothetical protein
MRSFAKKVDSNWQTDACQVPTLNKERRYTILGILGIK